MKMDSFCEGICITDLKVVQNFKSLAFWRYDLQGAVYAEGVRIALGQALPFYLAAATCDRVTDFDIFQIPRPTLDLALAEIEQKMPRFIRVKQGIVPLEHCGICDYCKSIKKSRIRSYNELLTEWS